MAFGDCLKTRLINKDFLKCEQKKTSKNAFWRVIRDVAVEDLKCYGGPVDSDKAIKTYYSILSEHKNFLPAYLCKIEKSNKQEKFYVALRNSFTSNAFHPQGLANQPHIVTRRFNNEKRSGSKTVYQYIDDDCYA